MLDWNLGLAWVYLFLSRFMTISGLLSVVLAGRSKFMLILSDGILLVCVKFILTRFLFLV